MKASEPDASLAPDPQAVLAAVRAHRSIEKNLHWTMEATFDKDRCRIRNDDSPSEFRRNPPCRL
jgi:predicted transposase YbfD/YdcC